MSHHLSTHSHSSPNFHSHLAIQDSYISKQTPNLHMCLVTCGWGGGEGGGTIHEGLLFHWLFETQGPLFQMVHYSREGSNRASKVPLYNSTWVSRANQRLDRRNHLAQNNCRTRHILCCKTYFVQFVLVFVRRKHSNIKVIFVCRVSSAA